MRGTLGLVGLFAVTAAGGFAPSGAFAQSGILVLEPNIPVSLGSGVSSGDGRVFSQCVDVVIKDEAKSEGQIAERDSRKISNRQALHEFLSVSVAAQASAVSYAVSASASFAEAHDLTTFDLNYFVHETVVEQGTTAVEVKLKRDVIDQSLQQPDPSAWFLSKCGDGYVMKLVQGGELLASVQIGTTSSQDYQSISGSIGVAVPIGSAAAAFTSAVTKNKKNEQLIIKIKRSGSVTKLAGSLTELEKEVEEFPGEVHKAPTRLRAVVQTYTVLPDLPNGIAVGLDRRSSGLCEMFSGTTLRGKNWIVSTT